MNRPTRKMFFARAGTYRKLNDWNELKKDQMQIKDQRNEMQLNSLAVSCTGTEPHQIHALDSFTLDVTTIMKLDAHSRLKLG